MRLINTFIFSNIFLSVGAVLLTVSAQVQLEMKPHWQPYLLLIFFATLFEYNRDRIILLFAGNNILISEKGFRVERNKKQFVVFVFISAMVLLIAIFTIEIKVLLTFFPLGIITFFYSYPFFYSKKCLFKLREIPYLKIFLIAFVWSASTIFLPAIHDDGKILNSHVLLLLAERFFFIFAIAIQFDIRDMQTDRDAGLKTIPILINRKNSFLLSYFSLFICLIISFLHYRTQNESFVISALSISVLTTYLFIKMHFSESSSKFYYQILDGTLSLQGFLVLVFYFRHLI